MVESLNILTGMPTASFMSADNSNDEMWDIIKKVDDRQWVITASDVYEIDGLPGGHAYTVLGAQKLYGEKGELVEKMVKMRNPWGSEVYTGKWNDNDPVWTQFYRD